MSKLTPEEREVKDRRTWWNTFLKLILITALLGITGFIFATLVVSKVLEDTDEHIIIFGAVGGFVQAAYFSCQGFLGLMER